MPQWVEFFSPLIKTLTRQYENPSDDSLRYFSGIHFDVGNGAVFLIATPHDENYFRRLDAARNGEAEIGKKIFIFSDNTVDMVGIKNKSPIKIMYRFGGYNGVGRYCNCLYVPKEYVTEISQRIDNLRKPEHERIQESIRKAKEKKQLRQQSAPLPSHNENKPDDDDEPVRDRLGSGFSLKELILEDNIESPREAICPVNNENKPDDDDEPVRDRLGSDFLASKVSNDAKYSSISHLSEMLNSGQNFMQSQQPTFNFSTHQPCQVQESSTPLDFPSLEVRRLLGERYLPCLVQEPLVWLTKAIYYRLKESGKLDSINGYANIVNGLLLSGFHLPETGCRMSQYISEEIEFMESRISSTENIIVAMYLLIRQYMVLFSHQAQALIASRSVDVKTSMETELGEFKVRIAELLTSTEHDKRKSLTNIKQELQHGMGIIYRLWSLS